MKKILLIPLTFATAALFAEETYVVKVGDTLSSIIKEKFPGKRIYSKEGQLVQVLKKNAHIENADRIYPGQVIRWENGRLIAEKKIQPPLEKEVVSPEPVSEPIVSLVSPDDDKWVVSIFYGPKFLSTTQSGAMGNAKIGTLLFDELKIKSSFKSDDWEASMMLSTFKFKYDSLLSNQKIRLNAFQFTLGHQWYYGGVGLEQNPIFRNNNNTIQLSKVAHVNAELGVKKEIKLKSRKPTHLKLKSGVKYTLGSSSDNSQVEINSTKGFGIHAEAELSREVYRSNDYAISVGWLTQAGYQKTSQNVKWDVSNGKVEKTIVNISSALGLNVEF